MSSPRAAKVARGAAMRTPAAKPAKSVQREAAQIEAGEQVLPLPQRGGATATDVMVTASGLLKAANLAVFELGMWQSWTGR